MTADAARLKEALDGIRRIAAEIVGIPADPTRKMSDLFSEGAIQAKTNACLELALAVAACKGLKPLRDAHHEIQATQDAVIAADNALASYITLNPETMSHVLGAELKVFDWLLAANPLLLVLARLAPVLKPYVATYLHKEFVSLRIEILLHEKGARREQGKRRGRCYGERDATLHKIQNEVVAEMRRRKKKTGLSWPKVVAALRGNSAYAARA